jgi:hypothetical protein
MKMLTLYIRVRNLSVSVACTPLLARCTSVSTPLVVQFCRLLLMQKAAGQLLSSFRATVCLLDIPSVFYMCRSAPHPQQRPVDNGQSSCYPRTCVPTFGSYRREHFRRTLSATWWFDCSSTAIFLQPFYHACLKIHVSLFWGRKLRFQHDGTPAHYGYTQEWSKATCSVVSCKRRPWFNRLTYCAI